MNQPTGCTCFKPWLAVIPPPPCPVHDERRQMRTVTYDQGAYRAWDEEYDYMGRAEFDALWSANSPRRARKEYLDRWSTPLRYPYSEDSV